MYDFDSSKKITNSSAIYEANTVAVFPLSEKVVNNIEQPGEMGMQALMSRSASYCHTEKLTQLLQSDPKKRENEEMKGGNRKHGREKNHKSYLNYKS